jgi:acyl carrier protein
MSAVTREQILADLAGMLRNFHGYEYSGEIGPKTHFFADLGLASIDAVVLGETIEEQFGRKFPFNQFMADLGRRPVRDIEIGDLADFLVRHLNDQPRG